MDTEATTTPRRRGRRTTEPATEAILAQLVDAFEGARLAQGLSVTQVARRAHVSKRSIGLAKAGAGVYA